MNDDAFLTTEEVLQYLQLNLKTVYRLVKAGQLPAVRVGRQWRFRRRDIDAWLAAATRPQAIAAPGSRASVLVVDDDQGAREVIASTLRANNHYDVETAADIKVRCEANFIDGEPDDEAAGKIMVDGVTVFVPICRPRRHSRSSSTIHPNA